MSHSILKRSLQIVEGSLNPVDSKPAKNKKKGNQQLNRPRDAVIDLIPEHQRLSRDGKIKKKGLQKQVMKQKQMVTLKQAQNRIDRQKGKLDENLQKLLILGSSSKACDDKAEMLIRRARAGHYVIPEKKIQEEATSAFTEEDWAKFEKEFFCS